MAEQRRSCRARVKAAEVETRFLEPDNRIGRRRRTIGDEAGERDDRRRRWRAGWSGVAERHCLVERRPRGVEVVAPGGGDAGALVRGSLQAWLPERAGELGYPARQMLDGGETPAQQVSVGQVQQPKPLTALVGAEGVDGDPLLTELVGEAVVVRAPAFECLACMQCLTARKRWVGGGSENSVEPVAALAQEAAQEPPPGGPGRPLGRLLGMMLEHPRERCAQVVLVGTQAIYRSRIGVCHAGA